MNAGRAVKRTRVMRANRSPVWLRALRVMLMLLALLAVLSLLVEVHPVRGHSMNPTLREGEWVLLWRGAYLLRAPAYGDLVACRFPGQDATWIKRVVGLPEDVLYGGEGTVYRNGAPLEEPYLGAPTPAFAAVKAWPEQYLLLGDHREDSLDSRHPGVGAVARERLTGRAVCVLWPPACWRWL